MNRYHYRALNNSIIGAAFIIMAGQFHMVGDTKMAWLFGIIAGIQILCSIMNEGKAEKES